MCDAFIPPGCGSAPCCDRGPTEARMSCAKRSHELKGGVYTKCECILRNGLQDSCMRVECQQRPAARKACLKKAGLDTRYEDTGNSLPQNMNFEIMPPQQNPCKPKMQMQMQMPMSCGPSNGLGDMVRCGSGQIPMSQMTQMTQMPLSMQMQMPIMPQMANFSANGMNAGNCGPQMQSFQPNQLNQMAMGNCQPLDQIYGQALMANMAGGGGGAGGVVSGFGGGGNIPDMQMFYQQQCGGSDAGGAGIMAGNMLGGGGGVYQAGPPTFSPASQQQMQFNPTSFQAMPQTMMSAPPPSGIGAFGDGQTQQYPCF